MFLVYMKGMKGPEPQLVSDLDVLQDVNGKLTDRLLEFYELPTPVGADSHALSVYVRKYPCKKTWPQPYDEPPLVVNSNPGPTPLPPAAPGLPHPSTLVNDAPADEDYCNKFTEKYLGGRATVG